MEANLERGRGGTTCSLSYETLSAKPMMSRDMMIIVISICRAGSHAHIKDHMVQEFHRD